ncbi:MAG: hypothetical protein QOH60_5486 [Mycobacterium sp.]|jgi:hypothetical protein|nr:hypothetical protein [Mycobacterium sp.]
MTDLTVGKRLRSNVCDTKVMRMPWLAGDPRSYAPVDSEFTK